MAPVLHMVLFMYPSCNPITVQARIFPSLLLRLRNYVEANLRLLALLLEALADEFGPEAMVTAATGARMYNQVARYWSFDYKCLTIAHQHCNFVGYSEKLVLRKPPNDRQVVIRMSMLMLVSNNLFYQQLSSRQG